MCNAVDSASVRTETKLKRAVSNIYTFLLNKKKTFFYFINKSH